MLRIHMMSVSLDGYVAGPRQGPEDPIGLGGLALHEWALATATMRRRFGEDGGTTGVDDEECRAGERDIGATIMGRNMFGPVRGPWESWGDEQWTGWWGATPPFGHDVFVLTHHPRAPLTMEGGTTFHFLDATPTDVLDRATRAAGGLDVRLGGGAATIRQFLAEGLVDEMTLVHTPVLLGAGERIFEEPHALPEHYECQGLVPGESGVAHARVVRRR